MKRFLSLLMLLFVIYIDLSAQEFRVETPVYEWINYDLNRIRIPGADSTRFHAFFRRVDSLFVFGTGNSCADKSI